MKEIEEVIENLKSIISAADEIDENREDHWIDKIHKLKKLLEETNEIGEIIEHRFFRFKSETPQTEKKKLIIRVEDLQYRVSNHIRNLITENTEEDSESIIRMMYPNNEDREIELF